jgi:hypothetical protein
MDVKLSEISKFRVGVSGCSGHLNGTFRRFDSIFRRIGRIYGDYLRLQANKQFSRLTSYSSFQMLPGQQLNRDDLPDDQLVGGTDTRYPGITRCLNRFAMIE